MSENGNGESFYVDTKFGKVGARGMLSVFVLTVGIIVGLGAYHHHLLSRDIERAVIKVAELEDRLQKQAQLTALYICVSTLTKDEQREYRIYGAYCGTADANVEVQRLIRPEARK